ncbi:hypothetical protein CVS40_3406 [Lucilia cuprina]|nr:hypothetical protein CVS40_3406 [Lucilia cuprina]
MNIETMSQYKNRKRARQPQFDLNRSIPHVLPKVPRINKQLQKMSNSEGNLNRQQFVDLSGTISTRTQSLGGIPIQGNTVPQPNNLTTPSENITPEVREMVADEALVVQRSLEDKVRKMVQEEMTDIRKSLAELTKCVGDLSKSTAQNHSIRVVQNTSEPSTSDRTSQLDGRLNPRPVSDNSSENNHFNLGNVAIPYNGTYETGTNRPNGELTRIRVDKLGINFDGNPVHLSIDDFVFRLEHLQVHYQIPWSEILRDFHLLMSGSAREWYWLYVRTHGTLDWPGLRQALMGQYKTTRSNFEIMRDLVERKHQNGETIDSYFQAMCQIRSRLIHPIPEYDLIKIIKRNLKVNIGIIVYPISVSSVEQLRVECNEAERNFPRKDVRNMPSIVRPTKYVNELYHDNTEEIECSPENYEELAALNVNPQPRNSLITCWNCRQQGHVFMECPSMERTLFCYKCGRPNVITPRCPNCQSGNLFRSLGAKGGPRSAGNHPQPRIKSYQNSEK